MFRGLLVLSPKLSHVAYLTCDDDCIWPVRGLRYFWLHPDFACFSLHWTDFNSMSALPAGSVFSLALLWEANVVKIAHHSSSVAHGPRAGVILAWIYNVVRVKFYSIRQMCCLSISLKAAEDCTRLRVRLQGEMAVKRPLSVLLETQALFPALPPPRRISHSAVTWAWINCHTRTD